MKLFTGWVLAAGLVLAGTAAQAQGLSPYSRVSDFTGPYSEAPYYREEGDRGGSYYAPPPAAVPAPPRYGYGDGYAPAALVPPHEIYNIIREAGFSPLGIPRQRGYVYTIAVIDRGGEDGRLVIDGRSGQIIRFTPAWRMGGGFNGAFNEVHGRPVPMPVEVTEIRGAPRPPGSVPRVASRTVPVPKPNPLAGSAATAPVKPAAQAAVAKPAAEPTSQQAAKPAAEPPSQQATVAQAKPADAAPAATATVGQTQAKPAAPSILPTQDMPKAQGLD